jgi:hypothetical protein
LQPVACLVLSDLRAAPRVIVVGRSRTFAVFCRYGLCVHTGRYLFCHILQTCYLRGLSDPDYCYGLDYWWCGFVGFGVGIKSFVAGVFTRGAGVRAAVDMLFLLCSIMVFSYPIVFYCAVRTFGFAFRLLLVPFLLYDAIMPFSIQT